MSRNDMPVWPGWETVRLIGHGSFGAVYEIERDVLGETEKAALKLIRIPQNSGEIDEMRGEGFSDESITAAFKMYLKNIVAEYSLMRKMNGHSNVVDCDDVRFIQHDDGMGWDILIKMELLTPLKKALGKEDVSEEQVIRIGTDLCQALILCRRYAIIHRDIKPANIFVSKNGDYKLGDFGIAKTVEKTSGNTKIGTYDYMAPEVYHDLPYGSAVDIYSLGLVLYWLLNERRTPFLPLPPALPTADEREEARRQRFAGKPLPPPAHGSEKLKKIVLKACAYDPEDRYQSAEEMLRDLEALRSPARRTGAVKTAGGPASDAEENPTANASGSIASKGTTTLSSADTKTQTTSKGLVFGSHAASTKARKSAGEDDSFKNRRLPLLRLLVVAAAVLALLVLCFFTVHLWRPATCEEAESCRICGKTRGEALGHQWGDWEVVTEPSCTEPGEERRVCKNDNTHVEIRVIPALGHSYKGATCTEPAVCTVCGEQSAEPIGHVWGEPSYYWSADDSSVTAERICRNDPSHVERENAVASSKVTRAPTCTEKGETTYTATFSNSAFQTQTKTVANIPAIGHTWGEPGYFWSTDDSSMTAERVCSNDPSHVERETAFVSSRVTTAPTCTEKGETTYTASFSNSAFQTQTKTVANIPAIGHTWGEPGYFWSADNSRVTAERICSNDPSHVERETAFVSSRVTTAPTCTEKGETTYTASFSSSAFQPQAKTVTDVPATGHDWGIVSYTWSRDNSTVTAERVCSNDPSHVEREIVGTTAKVTSAATTSKMGETTYTATFSSSAFPAVSRTVEDIPTLAATPAPTPTPSPTPTARPSVKDVEAFGDEVIYPKSNSYLDSYETMYVKSKRGHSIYVYICASAKDEYRRGIYLYEQDEVTVIARESGMSCVIFTGIDGKLHIGWVGSTLLVYEY